MTTMLPTTTDGGRKTESGQRRRVVILGSTGSIGTQALEVISHLEAQPETRNDAPSVVGLVAGGAHLDLLASQAVAYRVPFVAVACTTPHVESAVRHALTQAAHAANVVDPVCAIFCGPDAASQLIAAADLTSADTVLNGITGSVGLGPTLAALATGATLALANKESLVVGGALLRQAMRRPGQIVPVDSEHSAIAQCLRAGAHGKGLTCLQPTGDSEVRRLILTASGGPFRGRYRADLATVTAQQALAHPTWAMGPVVTVNSSTLINKGLELIEAHLLFDISPADIEVVVHPPSIIHSMVEFIDGATIAQASPPDMRLPIALGLTWPRRADLSGLVQAQSWQHSCTWDFEPLDAQTFTAVDLARAAVAASPTHPAVLNAANEQTVAAFLAGEIAWTDIVDIDTAVVESYEPEPEPLSVEAVSAAEQWARQRADSLISQACS